MAATLVADRAPGSRIVTLTPSQADVFDRCPFQYGARYGLGCRPGPRPCTAHTSMGESVHACLYHFHKRGGHQRHAREDIVGLLDQAWRGDGYDDREQEASFRRAAREMCEAYYDWTRDDAVRHLGHELLLSAEFRLAGFRLHVRGKLDRLSLWPDGRLEVVDYKTGRVAPSPADLAEGLAPFLYLLLVRRAYPAYERVAVSHLYLATGANVTVDYDESQRALGKARLVEAVAQIATGDFQPRPNAFCPSCPVRHLCPAMRQADVDLDEVL